MTFEEIHDKIIAGGRAESLEEVSGSLKVLSRYGVKTDAMIALQLEESKRLRGSKGWAAWAVANFGIADENTAHHRCAIGAMLYDMRDVNITFFKSLMQVEITKLEAIRPIHHQRQIDALVTFLKVNAGCMSESRKYIRALVAQLLDPDGAAAAQPLLALQFDPLSGVVEDIDLDRVTRSTHYDYLGAMLLTENGLKLCKAALPKLEAESEKFDLDEVEDLRRDILEVARRLELVINHKTTLKLTEGNHE